MATGGEDCTIPISALHGTGLSHLLQQLECAVIARTKRKFWKIILPLDGPELRSVYMASLPDHFVGRETLLCVLNLPGNKPRLAHCLGMRLADCINYC